MVKWVSVFVLPHEAELRGWLRRACREPSEVDDMIQDIYCRLLRLNEVSHITDVRAYLFKVARRLVIDKVRRSTVVKIEAGHNVEAIGVSGDPSPEQVALARAELKWVLGLIGKLPERCRRVIELRKILGMSQVETAQSLLLTENVVEKETARGLTLISAMIASAGGGIERSKGGTNRRIEMARYVRR